MKQETKNMLRNIREMIKNNAIEALKQTISPVTAFDMAEIIENLPVSQSAIVFRLLNKDHALEVFEYIEPEVQQNLLQAFADAKAVEFFAHLEPDDQAAVLDELPATFAKALLNKIKPEDRELVHMLMGYPAGSAGRAMTPKYIRLEPEMTVEAALEKIRQRGDDIEAVYHLYVTNASRVLVGMVELRRLITANLKDRVNDVMETQPVFVHADTAEEHAASILQDADLLALPVVDRESRLIGVITVDDAMDMLEEESIERALSKAGFADVSRETSRSRILTHGNLLQVWRVRLPYLMLALLGGLLAGGAIAQFEDQLEAIAALAFFIPVIMDMGGNVGTQSSTIFTRALIFGHINFGRFVKTWLREVLIGFSMGIISATIAGLIVYLWQDDFRLTIVVSTSLVATITIASAIGFLVPAALSKLGFDQAAGSDPFITTIKDISGLLIYFFLALWILGI